MTPETRKAIEELRSKIMSYTTSVKVQTGMVDVVIADTISNVFTEALREPLYLEVGAVYEGVGDSLLYWCLASDDSRIRLVRLQSAGIDYYVESYSDVSHRLRKLAPSLPEFIRQGGGERLSK